MAMSGPTKKKKLEHQSGQIPAIIIDKYNHEIFSYLSEKINMQPGIQTRGVRGCHSSQKDYSLVLFLNNTLSMTNCGNNHTAHNLKACKRCPSAAFQNLQQSTPGDK